MSSPIHFYTVKVVQNAGGKGGAEGRVATLSEPNNAHFPKITVQSPQEFKGPKAEDGKSFDWTPEDLFISSVAVCFFTTFVAIAENSKINYGSFEIIAKGKLEKVEGQGQIISEIEEEVTVKILDANDRDKVLRVLEKVEKGCLIANSMKSKITSKFNIIV